MAFCLRGLPAASLQLIEACQGLAVFVRAMQFPHSKKTNDRAIRSRYVKWHTEVRGWVPLHLHVMLHLLPLLNTMAHQAISGYLVLKEN
jgi:hypothetical protein